MGRRILLSGHVIGLLKGYMRDLVEQATQEQHAYEQFGFTPAPYRPDQALSDLLALLDDRIESEGIQVGIPEHFLHDIWTLCDEAVEPIATRIWLEARIDGRSMTKAQTREQIYQALIEFIEWRSRERS
jgi:hypothetical protein